MTDLPDQLDAYAIGQPAPLPVLERDGRFVGMIAEQPEAEALQRALRDASAELRRLRCVVRVNALRHGASDAEIDATLAWPPARAAPDHPA